MDIGPPELLIILIVVLLLFGGKKLPELARSIGLAKKEFEKGSQGETAEEKPAAKAPESTPADSEH